MTDLLNRMTRWIKRVSNPLASPKTRARNLLKIMEEQGLRVVSTEELADLTPHPFAKQLEETFNAWEPTGRKERAQWLYQEERWDELYAHKRAAKVGWDRLGFTERQIEIIGQYLPE
jgi:hypothetical protein